MKKLLLTFLIIYLAAGCRELMTRTESRDKLGKQQLSLFSAESPSKTLCTYEDYEPLNLVIVVDNTASNSCTPGVAQDASKGLCGTDPIQTSGRFSVSPYTHRQKSLHWLVTSLVEEELQLKKSHADFVGSNVGIISFPKGADEESLGYSVTHSGAGGVLPNALTNTLSLSLNTTFREKLWDLLKFTHHPAGLTPYSTALKGALRLFENVALDDNRKNAILFISDGLPTDERPSQVRALKRELGRTPIVLVSIYEAGKNSDDQNAYARETLRKLWDDERQWGHKEGDNDGYEPGDFEKYWNDLVALPEEISDETFTAEGSVGLSEKLLTAVNGLRGCGKK